MRWTGPGGTALGPTQRGLNVNQELQNFARKTLKDGLSQLPDRWQTMFKRMYATGDLTADISDVVDKMPEEKLDWAMDQVRKSISKLNASKI